MSNPSKPGEEIPLRYLFQVLFRHKKKSFSFFVLALLVTLAGVLSLKDSYVSEARLLIKVGRESVTLDPTVTAAHTVDARQSREQELNSELAILKSADICREVAQAMETGLLEPPVASDDIEASAGLLQNVKAIGKASIEKAKGHVREYLGVKDQPSMSTEDQVFLAIRRNLGISLVPNSNVMSLSYEAPSPEAAQLVLSLVVEKYLDKHLALHQTPGSYRFLSQQAEKLSADLSRTEKALRDLKTSTGVASVEEHRLVLLEALGAAEREASAAQADRVSFEAELASLRKGLEAIPSTIVLSETQELSSPSRELLLQRIAELELEEQGLEGSFREDSRRRTSIRKQIESGRRMLEELEGPNARVTNGANPLRQEIESAILTVQSRLSSVNARLSVLEARRKELEQALVGLNDIEFRVSELVRTAKVQEASYLRYTENLEQARVDQALQVEKISNIRVLQPATRPLKSTGTSKVLLFMAGLVLSLVGAVGLGFVAEMLDQSIRVGDDVRAKLDLQTLTSVPKSFRYHRKPTTIHPEIMALKDAMVRFGNTSEAPPVVFGVTSAHSGEGVSTVCAHLALALAHQGEGPVVLVDASVQKPSQHQIFGLDLSPGLAESLDGSNPHKLQKTNVPDLFVLTAGRGRIATSDLLTVERFETLLSKWRDRSRFVVVDLPAVGELSRASQLASRCDETLLVVEAEKYRWQIVDNAKRSLSQAKAVLPGVVLNKRRYHIPKWLYRAI